MCVCVRECCYCYNKTKFRGFAKKKKSKSEIAMEVGGWVQVSLGICFLENRPKIGLKQFLE